MNFFRRQKKYADIAPDEIFLDAQNTPRFDSDQFEGRIEKPVSARTGYVFMLCCVVIGCVFVWKLFSLQVVNGETYRTMSENNRLDHSSIFAERGAIYDRVDVPLAWNTVDTDSTSTQAVFPLREYIGTPGFGHVLGFISYPQRDAKGIFFEENTLGKAGVEKVYNKLLQGNNGKKIQETNAHGDILSESIIEPTKPGEPLQLTVDARLQEHLYRTMADTAERVGFTGGGGIIVDVHTGEVLALASYPDYDPNVLLAGTDDATIDRYATDSKNYYLNRVIGGRYAPGSIVKPFVAIGALTEKVITPEKQIYSAGQLEVPNPYDPEHPSIFKDNAVHGWVDMRRALAVSSNVYFFEIGGGFEKQKGLGIENIEKYTRMFGIGSTTDIDLVGEIDGVIPNPAWKAINFPGDPWRVGDTYNTAIGQYGFQVTPIQMVRAVSAIANGGMLITPRVVARQTQLATNAVSISDTTLQIIREGMRQGVTDGGTPASLNISGIAIAAKTGTAQVGITKQRVNSWVMGFWPYENPRYAFTLVMEQGPLGNAINATYVMQQFFEWMTTELPEYAQGISK